MTQKISSVNIETTTLSSFVGPLISTVSIANSSYVIVDDTAISNAGGYAVITGNNFVSGAQVLFGSTSATSVTYVNSSTLRVQVPALTAGSYVMYVQNPDGSTAIRLNGITSSPIPVWSTGSTLTDQDLGASFSINLSASSDSSVIYALSAGSSLPPGTTLASNGLFSGAITGIESQTTFNFSVDAIDAENQETVRSFSVTVTVGDANYKDTILHLNGETSNNTWITDASSNAFALTVTGDTKPVAFSPYETVWSNLFDGTGDYLTVPNVGVSDFGIADFAVEMWIFPTSLSTQQMLICAGSFTPVTGADDAWYIQIGINNSGNLATIKEGVTLYTVSGWSIVVNQWQHLAFTRSSGSLRLFINGVQVGSTVSANITVNSNAAWTTRVGVYSSSSARNWFGYVSNLRILKGTALYTTNFTPPTSPLTAITNTSLLTCQSNRLIDNSTNNFTITKNGNVSVSNFGPFVETDLITGSGYFDGTGDYLRAAYSNPAFTFGTNDLTIECWIYQSDAQNAITNLSVIAQGQSSAQAGASLSLFKTTARTISLYASNGATYTVTIIGNVPSDQWVHVAGTRNGSTWTLWINGVSAGTATYSGTVPQETGGSYGGIDIGSLLGLYPYAGYISNVRVINGTAVYTSAFTPPTSPLTAIANTSLLTLQSRIGENNNRFVDTSGINNLITRNGNATQGIFSPHSRTGWSNYFDGTGDYLSVPSNTEFAFGTGNFTVEAWLYLPVTQNFGGVFISSSTGLGDALHIQINSTTRVRVTNESTQFLLATNAIPLNKWTHIAVVRSGTTLAIYQDGVLNGSVTNSTSFIQGGPLIGFEPVGGGFYFNGYISNLRTLKGTALYTTAFTPSTSPLTAITNTGLLTCQSYRFLDNSLNNSTITKTGDVSVQSFSPFAPAITTPTSYSGYFDGTGDYLSLTDNNALDFGTGNFAVECWFFATSLPASNLTIIDARPAATEALEYYFYITTTQKLQAVIGETTLTGTTTLVANRWYHAAFTKNGTSVQLFLDGVVETSGTNNQSISAGLFNIGYKTRTSSSLTYFLGYISNVRIVNGTAVYTTAFTPSTSPLTAIANTSLLTCQSNTFIDNSANKFTITVNGDASPRSFNPFGTTSSPQAYSITNVGGSTYFDGTGDYVSTIDKLDLRPGTSNFTLEAWIYRDAVSVAHTIYAKGGASTGIVLQVTSTNVLRFTHTATNVDSTITIPAKAWTHVAVVREGVSTNQTKLYINGVLAAQSTVATDFTQTEEARIGTNRGATENFNGYISNLRFVKGTAIYTSAFDPPTAPLIPIAGTTLLSNSTNGGIIDYTGKNNLETVGNAQLRNNIVKYGVNSSYFDGASGLFSGVNIAVGTGAFTYETWVYPTVSSHLYPAVVFTASGILHLFGFADAAGASLTSLKAIFGASTRPGSGNSWFTAPAISQNVWTHLAFVRSGTTISVYVNGVSQTITTTNGTNTSRSETTNISYIGRSAIGEYFTGYLDDLRITKGVARYTANFTPPTSAFKTR